jgi:hypothetical protein
VLIPINGRYFMAAIPSLKWTRRTGVRSVVCLGFRSRLIRQSPCTFPAREGESIESASRISSKNPREFWIFSKKPENCSLGSQVIATALPNARHCERE